MKIRKKTLDAIHSMLAEWHGMEEAGNSLVNFHPQPVGIDSLLDKIVARAVPPWERKLNEIKLSWAELAGNETARRCQVSHLNDGVLYIEVFHPAYRMALDTPKIKSMMLEKVQKLLGAANCRELKFIPVGRTAPGASLCRRTAPPSPKVQEKKEKYPPDLPL